MDPLAFTLRPASAADAAFIYDVNEITLKPHVEAMARKWATARMREKCDNDAIDPNTRIIQVDGIDCGVYALAVSPTEIWLHAMLLLPTFQRRGIGRRLLERALAEAKTRGIPMRLIVMRANPAKAFYERYGFTVSEETDEYYVMSMDLESQKS